MAFVIDVLVLTVIEAPLFFMGIRHHHAWAYLGATATASAYHIIGIALWGRTVGKLVMRVRVRPAHSDGQVVGWWRSTIRYVVPAAQAIALLAPFTALVQLLWLIAVYGTAVTDPRKQGLHDHAAGTVVVATGG